MDNAAYKMDDTLGYASGPEVWHCGFGEVGLL